MALLGGFDARIHDGKPVSQSRKGSVLVSFLALQPGGKATRERLMTLLWSDRAEHQARGSLRQELVVLRRQLGPLLKTDGEFIALDIADAEIDALTFERLCLEKRPEGLEAAVALYLGPFLGDLGLRDPTGDEWIQEQRARFEALLKGALRALLADRIDRGALTEAGVLARRLVALDPFCEISQRTLMTLLAAGGRRTEARQIFSDFEQRLRRELDVAPEEPTSALARELRSWSGGGEDRLAELLNAASAELAGRRPHAAAAAADRPARPEQPAIAVLPFSAIGAELATFGDGLVDGITGALSRIRSIFVIARASTQKYRNHPLDMPRIAEELGVRYLVLGSLHRHGARIRTHAQLVEAATGAMLWSDHHDGSLADTFDLQDRITERIVGAIAPSVTIAEVERARRKRPDSLVAYDYVMRALPMLWTMAREANEQACHLAREAIRLDPNYALAYAYASWCHFWGFANNWTDEIEKCRQEAYDFINVALRLDPHDPAVLSIAALSETAIRHDLDAARAYVEKAVQLDPNFAWGWNRSGYVQLYLDNLDTALSHFDRAARLSPFDPLNFNRYVGAGLAHYCAGRYEEAVRHADAARVERPGLPWAYRVLAAAHAELGNATEANRAARMLLANAPRLTVAQVMESMPFRRRDIAERFAAGLLRAGIPEAERVGDRITA